MRGRLWWRVLDGFLYRRSIGQKLKTGNDDMVTGLNAALNDIVVADTNNHRIQVRVDLLSKNCCKKVLKLLFFEILCLSIF